MCLQIQPFLLYDISAFERYSNTALFSFTNLQKSILKSIQIDIDLIVNCLIHFVQFWLRAKRLLEGPWEPLGNKSEGISCDPWRLLLYLHAAW